MSVCLAADTRRFCRVLTHVHGGGPGAEVTGTTEEEARFAVATFLDARDAADRCDCLGPGDAARLVRHFEACEGLLRPHDGEPWPN